LSKTRYCFASVCVDSEIPLPLLPSHPDGGSAELTLIDAGSTNALPSCWSLADLVVNPSSDDGGLELWRSEEQYLLRYIRSFDLVFSPSNRIAHIFLDPESDRATVEHLLLDQAVPRILGHFGHLMLHASAVEVDGRALCFVAPSGAGKSTLAAMLAATGRRVLADDVVRVDLADSGVVIHPGYPSLRLWADSALFLRPGQVVNHARMAEYSSKRVYRLGEESSGFGTCALAALILLSDRDGDHGATPHLRSLPPAAALMRLMAQSFALHVGESRMLRDRLRRMAAVCTVSQPRELVFARDYAARQDLLQALRPVLGSS